MKRTLPLSCAVAIVASSIFFLQYSALPAAEPTLKKTEEGYQVLIDGNLFVEYRTDYQGTPILWPIIGPTGKRMTRDYPMLERTGTSEAKDHPHHRSFWFTHGEIGDANFWALKKDRIVHRRFTRTECVDGIVILETENDWVTEKGQVLCTDRRTFRFSTVAGKNGPIRIIDFDIKLVAARDEVVWGDTKEGTFGIRVPGTLDLLATKRGLKECGHIVNAEGIRNKDTWGKRSDWVDYYGPVEGEMVGIAILNHPSSFRSPTYWHVRDYGLFAANPFGEHDFEDKKAKTGEHRMNQGDSFTLRYRVLFHTGDADAAGIADAFTRYRETEF